MQKIIKSWGGNAKNGLANLKPCLVEVSGAPQKFAGEKERRLAKQQPNVKNVRNISQKLWEYEKKFKYFSESSTPCIS